MTINWDLTPKERKLIDRIGDRAMALCKRAGIEADRVDVLMDIVFCHNNAYRLRLEDWLVADDFNFAHDLAGITRHINRETATFDRSFLPRCAVKGE
jgi:hypothetical protein